MRSGCGVPAMKSLRSLSSLILVFLICVLCSGRTQAQGSTVFLGGTLVALQELKKSLESTVNTVDAESAARINQLSLAVDNAIKNVQKAIQDVSSGVQFNENKLFSDVFTVMS